MSEPADGRWREIAPAKVNLALHVRGKLPDGRHAIETVFAFCVDGDRLSGEPAEGLTLSVAGPFAADVGRSENNLVLRAARELAKEADVDCNASLLLGKNLPVAAGIGGGSADAGAALRLLTSLWGVDPAHASAVAPRLGADVPACLLSMTCRGKAAGDQIQLIDDRKISGTPLLLVNPRVALPTRDVFAQWDGVDRGPLDDWRDGRNDLEAPARALVRQIGDVLDWLEGQEAELVRMSGSGATCFALFADAEARDRAAAAVPGQWWHLATTLR
ncbi:MAG: 4-(cytidine 5'-diphospho)-2-C-methyl-D-erythritol kinase [Sphingomonas sp.]|nr:4-(cytidine 5'-diphospho)-2-C-methyl-D-erythritol kinase [Sphingomonas sp.]